VGNVSYIFKSYALHVEPVVPTGQRQFRIAIVILLSKMMLIVIFSLFPNVLLAHLDQPLFLNFGMLEVKKFSNPILMCVQVNAVEICFALIQRPPHFMARNATPTNNQTFHGSWVDAIEWLSRRLNFT
jgi:hypothetical protein